MPLAGTAKRKWEVSRMGTAKELVKRARARAKKYDLPFDITEEDVIVPRHCPALNIPLFPTEGRGGSDNSPSLDRLRPELGYVKGNVIVISTRANRLKGDANMIELLALCQWMAQVGVIK